MLDISDFPWAECAITENAPMYSSDSLNLKRRNLSTGAHRYEFELVTYDMDMSEGRSMMAKISKAKGGLLTYIHPRLSHSMGTVPEEGVLVNASQLKGDDVISVTSSSPWQLMAGDYIQFSNHSKVYQVSESTELASGVQVVELSNPLIVDINGGTEVTCNNVTWYLTSSGTIEAGMEAIENQDIQITITAVERL